VMASMVLEREPPRLVQGMVAKFIGQMPFLSKGSSRCGQFIGLPEHAHRLLEDERLLLVFPEGVRGTAKLYKDRYSLVRFGSGFIRMALQTRTPIIPFAFLGGGEAIPTVMNLYTLGKLVGAPYLPITPYLFPVPLPVPLEIHYGEPLRFSGSGAEDDEVIRGYAEQVKERIADILATARKNRPAGFFNSDIRS